MNLEGLEISKDSDGSVRITAGEGDNERVWWLKSGTESYSEVQEMFCGDQPTQQDSAWESLKRHVRES